jgi:hypothetical protein
VPTKDLHHFNPIGSAAVGEPDTWALTSGLKPEGALDMEGRG